ncbi:MAG: T9SS type A sorting domain-containing protein, partial [Bacteroidota bacterium]
ISQVDTLSYYSITINTSSGIAAAQGSKFEIRSLSPNPASSYTDFEFSVPRTGDYKIRMYNILGREVMSRSVRASAGLNKQRIDLSDKAAGVYVVSVQNGGSVLTQRLVVSK